MPHDVAYVVLIIELLPTQSDLKYCPALYRGWSSGPVDVAGDLQIDCFTVGCNMYIASKYRLLHSRDRLSSHSSMRLRHITFREFPIQQNIGVRQIGIYGLPVPSAQP